jgi:glycosyltransferase involved in cell wall biosynthesis
MMKSVLLLGAYSGEHARIVNISKALQSQGFTITKWNIRANLWVQYFRFIKSAPKIVRDSMKSRFIIVPWPGWRSLFFAKLVSILTRRKLILDAFISNYNTYVEDRRYVHPKSLRALSLLMQDRISCRLADIVLLDTNEHIEYFAKLLSIPKDKFLRVFVGVDIDEQMVGESNQTPQQMLTLFFAGTFIPLHGLKYIIEALDLLRKKGKRFRFILVGRGQEDKMIDAMIRNLKLSDSIERHSFLPYNRLLNLMKDADICLGIFGDTKKAKMVIPTKVFDYAAMNKIFITGDSKAMRELFTEESDFVGCSFADGKMLFDKLMQTISQLPDLRIIMKPRKTILMHANPEKIGLQLIRDLMNKEVLQ